KYRNLLGTTPPRNEWYEELQLDSARLDLYPIATSLEKMAFPSQYNAGAVIEVKALEDVGKANAHATSARLLRSHTQRVNSLAFSPFEANLLVSGADDCTFKLWSLGENDECAHTITLNDRILSLGFHPSAKDILYAAMNTDVIVLSLETNQVLFEAQNHPNAITGVTWNENGSLLLSICQDKNIRAWDPRSSEAAITTSGHQGRKAASITWAFESYFVTAGFNKLQERELCLWDVRSLEKPIGRERMDSSTGLLQPLVDADTKLLFVGGRGDRSVRAYELQPDKKQCFSSLQQNAVATATWGLALLPKSICRTDQCEVARILSIGSQSIEPVNYTVPRKEAVNQFQADLYPDTKGSTPAMSATQWQNGENLSPNYVPIKPNSWISNTSAPSVTTLNGWNTPAVSTQPKSTRTAPVAVSTHPKTTLAATPEVTNESKPAWMAPQSAPAPLPQWMAKPAAKVAEPPSSSSWAAQSGWGQVPESIILPTATAPTEVTFELSEKAKRLGAIQGHKLKYITGRPEAKSESYTNVQADGVAFATNGSVWAASASGTGGPVIIHSVAEKGKVESSTIIHGHKAAVMDMEFSQFRTSILATASDDAIWDVDNSIAPQCTLEGHSKGVRCLSFHPSANNVLATGSMDATIRLWDLESGQSQQEITKFDESPFNISFNADGSLFATITRDKVLRIVDPRANQTVSMACAHPGSKAQRVVWCTQQASSIVFTVGFSQRSERQICLWDARNLLDPLVTTTIDTSGSALLPLYDASSNVMYLVGRGDRTILSYEIDTTKPAMLPCSIFSFQGPPISSAAFLPKPMCNIEDVELNRMLLLTSGSTIDPISFYLPRAEKLKSYFQDDVYGDIPTNTPTLSAEEWFSGETSMPNFTTLQPEGMPKLSDKPPDAPIVPKVIGFQARKQKELQEQKEKDERFERLHSLAYQPSLHANATLKQDDDSSDGGWDD
ncbi:coronin, partial [Thraustotheca clavata]